MGFRAPVVAPRPAQGRQGGCHGDGGGNDDDNELGPGEEEAVAAKAAAAKARARGRGRRRRREPFVDHLSPWHNCQGGLCNKTLLITHKRVLIA